MSSGGKGIDLNNIKNKCGGEITENSFKGGGLIIPKSTIQSTQQKHINELEKENEILHARVKQLNKELRVLRNKCRELLK